ncbi:hypothetical protein AOCH_000452 [Aspergillus ochraceoroseus]|uniref:Cupin 2 conserved barrel domain-containing protein n=1 Tax=Aspergillus ochraceoroseus TaxID=138278 RepID=A0A0F8X8T8_9EURO|nr:hypothetical protein AOCH_000452 [Aspergillus ochraceoroseus]
MSIPRVQKPPTDGSSYIINRMDGDIFTMPGLRGTFRFYASEQQTDNRISVFGWDGPADDQAFHHHKKTHDCFLITEGTMKAYCGDQCRILSPGDFCSVPPFTIHKPTPLGPITRVLPLITPAAWVNFFRDASIPFNGLMFPEFVSADRQTSIAQMLGPDFEEKYDNYNEHVENPPPVTPWTEADEVLPDGVVPYYLKYNSGPKWVLGGVSSRPFITTTQSVISFPNTHHCLVLLDGSVEVTLSGGSPTLAHAGDVIFLTAGSAFSIDFKTKYVRIWSYASGDGIEALIGAAGTPMKAQALPNEALEIDEAKVNDACKTLGIEIV